MPFNFMAAITICSDFGAPPQIKSITVSIVSPSTCHKGMGPNAMGSVVKNLPASAEDARDMGSIPWVGKSHWRRAWQPTPVFLPGESHGQRSLVGYSLWGRTESDTTEVTEQQQQPDGSVVKNLPASAGDTGSIPVSGRLCCPLICSWCL